MQKSKGSKWKKKTAVSWGWQKVDGAGWIGGWVDVWKVGNLQKNSIKFVEVERLILFLRLLIETVEKKKVIGMKFGWGKWKE